jgi:hypothetical protein
MVPEVTGVLRQVIISNFAYLLAFVIKHAENALDEEQAPTLCYTVVGCYTESGSLF